MGYLKMDKRFFNSTSARIVIVILCLFAIYPFVGSEWGIDLVTKIMIFAILALSLEILVGGTGLVCFGQAAFFGIGAYTTVLLSPSYDAGNILILLPASIIIAALYALFVGSLSLRTKGAYFIMVTLAFAQMAYYVVHDTPLGGGSDGIYLMILPSLPWDMPSAIQPFLDLSKAYNFYGFTLLCLAIVIYFLSRFENSRFGRALLGIKLNEQRMRASGYQTFIYKLIAFTISGGIAGLAGSLFALKDGFVNPELLGWHLSGSLLIMIILGGIGHLKGAVIGAASYMLLQEFFKSQAIFGDYASNWHLGVGITIILTVVLLPNGLVSIPAAIRRKLASFNQRGGKS